MPVTGLLCLIIHVCGSSWQRQGIGGCYSRTGDNDLGDRTVDRRSVRFGDGRTLSKRILGIRFVP